MAAGLAALAVLVFLGGRLAAPRPLPDSPSGAGPAGPPVQERESADLEKLRDRLTETEGRPLKRIPAGDLSSTAQEVVERLNARLDALAGTEKEQQQFIADVSHELRTPLTVLRGTLEVALEEDRSPEEYREAIGNALLEIRHLARISQNILFLARGESGRVTLSFSNQDLARFVAEVTRELQPAAGDHDLDLSVDVPEKPVIAFVDPGRMQQVLHNLIENAMRYTPPGGSVRVRLSRTRDEARIEVSDTGVGIPEKDLPFVFERFFRSDRARRAYTGGSGLGLSIVRWIVEAHKGKVEIASEVDRGTTVTVKLPLVT
ncbi:MAG TPA: HAMP domain-containing sensor histidine kinase [Thermoanaerobaculia bacterium]|nr:HAMP domain-containing sensor histidine kinase [Thermoanaerobaculia bacterium]